MCGLMMTAPAAAQSDAEEGCEIRSIEADVVVDATTVTLTNTRIEAVISEAAVKRWHDLGFLVAGVNSIPGTIGTTIAAAGAL
ncbi:MAG: hypothetical protein GWN79_21815, partial [Actinobacteria bacterium]|nr:hypothetical protein [Actinomycetota bacterium]